MSVETGSATNIMATGAEVDAMVIDIGETGLTEHGWCISISQNPSINDKKVNNGSKDNYGNYSNILTGLDPSTKYYVRSYISGNGTVLYGEQLELITSDLSFDIDFPTNNSILGTGQNYEIRWTANFNDRIKIELSKGGNFVKTIANELENNGSYAWTTNTKLSNADDYNLKLISVENEKVKAETAVFSIYDNALPLVISGEISNISNFSAKAEGSIENFGTESSVVQHGHCWSTNENPTIEDNKTELGTKNTIGNFTSELSNLLDNTTYYVRAYATNIAGTAYGNEINFTATASVTVTDYDGNVYNTVTIGNQVWMAENLKVTHYSDGTAIPLVTDNAAWANLDNNIIDKAYCYYNNSDANKDTYGALYTYAAASNGNEGGTFQGVCPTGWHLPNDTEWTELENYISNDGHSGTEGTALKSSSGWNNNGNGTDDYGFTAVPAGFRTDFEGVFGGLGNWTYWHISYRFGNACRGLYYSYSYVDPTNHHMSGGYSVRCIKNDN